MTEPANPFRERLSSLIPLNRLTPTQQEQLLVNAEVLNFRKKDAIFQQGERDQWAFYLLSGALEMWANDQLIKKINGSEAAALQPLAQLQPRQMSALAVSPAQVLRIDRTLLDKLLSADLDEPLAATKIEVEEYESNDANWLTSLLQSPLFARIPPSNIQRLIDTLEVVACQAGDVVIQQGAVGDYYYIIQSGGCEVCRATSLGKEIRLAELGPGDTFGEEALISNAKRNATVRMLTPGSLGRLTQNNFIELIRKPLLRAVDLTTADALVKGGGCWLDVRFPEEHRANGKPDSRNIPLSLLRAKLKDLARDRQYITYCDTGGRSSAAAFLLTQEGFDVVYVESGAITEIDAPRPPVSAARETATAATPLVAAEAREQNLATEVATANLQIEQARRLMAEAAAAKEAVDQYVAQRLEQEKARLQEQISAVRGTLADAQRLKATLEQQHAAAREEAAKQRAAHVAKTAELQQRVELALQDKERRLEALYLAQTAKAEALQAEDSAQRQTLQKAWQALELESSQSRERLVAAQRLETEIVAREAAQQAQFAARETEIRTAFKLELTAERQRFETEFVRFADEIAATREESRTAEHSQQSAAAASAVLLSDHQSRQQQQLAAQQQLATERAALAREAEALRAQMRAAVTAREVAEQTRDRALEGLKQAQRELQLGSSVEGVTLSALELKVAHVSEALAAALKETAQTATRQEDNVNRLAQCYASEHELNLDLQRQLASWIATHSNA